MLSNYLKNKQQHKFQLALLTEDVAQLRKMISKGADINSPFAMEPDQETLAPLLHAIQIDAPECLKVLLENGALIPTESALQQSFLKQAILAQEHPLALLSLLLEHRLDANCANGEAFFLCLGASDTNLQLLLITRLMEHGGDINVRNENNHSVLDLLMLAEQTQLVGSLISAGAKVSVNLEQLTCSDEIKAFALRKQQDLEIQKMLMGHG